jgi:hypothetical protein
MNSRKEYLRRRREWLVSQAAAQRSEVSYIASQLQKSLRWVDMGFAVGQALRTHPVLAVAGASLLLRTSKTKRLLWAGQLFTAWELFNVVRKQWPRRQI